jgi:hypothetical protein
MASEVVLNLAEKVGFEPVVALIVTGEYRAALTHPHL